MERYITADWMGVDSKVSIACTDCLSSHADRAVHYRYVNKDDVDEILAREEHDPAAVVECGLRLINNENIKNPNFLVAVALALLF